MVEALLLFIGIVFGVTLTSFQHRAVLREYKILVDDTRDRHAALINQYNEAFALSTPRFNTPEYSSMPMTDEMEAAIENARTAETAHSNS